MFPCDRLCYSARSYVILCVPMSVVLNAVRPLYLPNMPSIYLEYPARVFNLHISNIRNMGANMKPKNGYIADPQPLPKMKN